MTKKAHLMIKNAKWAYHVRDEHKKHLFGVWGVTPHISLEKRRLVRVFARWSGNIFARLNHFTHNRLNAMRERGTEGGGGSAPPPSPIAVIFVARRSVAYCVMGLKGQFSALYLLASPLQKIKKRCFLLLSQIRAKKNYTFGTKITITALFSLTYRYFYGIMKKIYQKEK